MAQQQPNAAVNNVSEAELKSIVGNVDQDKIIEIMKLRPTPAELEEAAMWASGDGDVLSKQGHSLAAKVAEIVEILTADEEESPEK